MLAPSFPTSCIKQRTENKTRTEEKLPQIEYDRRVYQQEKKAKGCLRTSQLVRSMDEEKRRAEHHHSRGRAGRGKLRLRVITVADHLSPAVLIVKVGRRRLVRIRHWYGWLLLQVILIVRMMTDRYRLGLGEIVACV